MTDSTRGEKILKRGEELFNSPERSNARTNWSLLSEFLLNNQSGRFNTSRGTPSLGSKGEEKMTRVYDTTGIKAVEDLANAFQSILTNPATIWSDLKYESDKLNKDDQAVEWLKESNKRIHQELKKSNFDQEVAKSYKHFSALANKVLFTEEIEGELSFTSFHLGQLAWAEDRYGNINRLYRSFEMTAEQAVERWGRKLSTDILSAYEEHPDKVFEFMHYIGPRQKKKVKVDKVTGLAKPKNRPFEDIYLEVTTKHIISEEGYYEFPALITRWSLLPGEVYGRGPGHLAIPDVRSLNLLTKRYLERMDLCTKPPTLINRRDYFSQLNFKPGSFNIVHNVDGVRRLNPEGSPQEVQFMIERLQNNIRSIFYIDKLFLPDRKDTGEMTAYEIQERLAEMHKVLGPVLLRLSNEFLQPLMARLFRMLLRMGKLAPPPESVLQQGLDIDIVFVNQLAQAQKIQDLSVIQQWENFIMTVAQLNPMAADNLDVDGAVLHAAEVLGVPPQAIKKAEDRDKMRQDREAAAQVQLQAQMANLNADTASKQS